MKNFVKCWLQKIKAINFFADFREKETYRIYLEAMRANSRYGAWPKKY
jgi:hypothetical protein